MRIQYVFKDSVPAPPPTSPLQHPVAPESAAIMRRMFRGMMHGAAAHGVLFFKPGLQAQRLHHPVRDKNELLGGAGVQYAASDA